MVPEPASQDPHENLDCSPCQLDHRRNIQNQFQAHCSNLQRDDSLDPRYQGHHSSYQELVNLVHTIQDWNLLVLDSSSALDCFQDQDSKLIQAADQAAGCQRPVSQVRCSTGSSTLGLQLPDTFL